MTEQSRNMIEAEGRQYLERDLRLALRPQLHIGESQQGFVSRLAAEYRVSITDVVELLGDV